MTIPGDSAWRHVRWMVMPALSRFEAMAGASGEDALVAGRRALEEARRDFDASPTPEGGVALYAIATWLVAWAAVTGSPPSSSAEFRDVLADAIQALDRVRRKALELE